jgi:nitrite reductase (NADH) small subunit
MTWSDVCSLDDLTPNRGIAALLGEQQVAVFLIEPGDELLAIDNHDPFSGAAVLSRGLVGSAGDALTVASPVYKQRFDLRSGRCLDDPDVAVTTFAVRVVDGRVQVGASRC